MPCSLGRTFPPCASPSASRCGSSRTATAFYDQTVASSALWQRRERLTHQEETAKRTTWLSKPAAPRCRALLATKRPGMRTSRQARTASGTATPPRCPGSSAAESSSSSSSSRPSNQAFYFDYRRRWRLAFSHLTLMLCSYRAWGSYRRRLSATSASSPAPREPAACRPPRWPPPRRTSWIPAWCCSRSRPPTTPQCPLLIPTPRRVLGTGDRVARPACTTASASSSSFASGIWICLYHLSPGTTLWADSSAARRRKSGDGDTNAALCDGRPVSASAGSPRA